LASGVGVLPLAPVSKVSKREIPDLVKQMAQRFARKSREPSKPSFGLRLSCSWDYDTIKRLLKPCCKESTIS
ncbi:MAG TPA: hypothetical protein VK137_14115, partial [Planctomycetaceae bacterium]|nr:hypothetical protein [Planctomycetaceae bacterium]